MAQWRPQVSKYCAFLLSSVACSAKSISLSLWHALLLLPCIAAVNHRHPVSCR